MRLVSWKPQWLQELELLRKPWILCIIIHNCCHLSTSWTGLLAVVSHHNIMLPLLPCQLPMSHLTIYQCHGAGTETRVLHRAQGMMQQRKVCGTSIHNYANIYTSIQKHSSTGKHLYTCTHVHTYLHTIYNLLASTHTKYHTYLFAFWQAQSPNKHIPACASTERNWMDGWGREYHPNIRAAVCIRAWGKPVLLGVGDALNVSCDLNVGLCVLNEGLCAPLQHEVLCVPDEDLCVVSFLPIHCTHHFVVFDRHIDDGWKTMHQNLCYTKMEISFQLKRTENIHFYIKNSGSNAK